jgi:anti-sigma regulatory factor (Ser/Thr protein kinase)
MAPAAVRHALADRSDAQWVIGDVMLVASELVTNAVLHSGCLPGDMISVNFRMRPDGVMCSVSDPHRTLQDAEPASEDQLVGGFGLRVVEQLAERWGAECLADGRYRVWVEMAREPQASV